MSIISRDWLSSAPDRWTRGRLKDLISSAVNGAWGNEPLNDDTDVFCVRAADFDRQRNRVSLAKLPRRHIDLHTKQRHNLQNGDLILEKSGGGENQPVGAAVIFDHDFPAVCSNFCARLRPADDVDPSYLSYILAAAYSMGLTVRATKQTTGIQNLDSGLFFSEKWAFPSLIEQRRIADFLDTESVQIDHVGSMRLRQRNLLDERAQAAAVTLVKSCSSDSVELRRLGVSVTTGPFGTVLSAGEYIEDGIPVVNPSHIRHSTIVPSRHETVTEIVASRLRRHWLEANDIVVSRKGDLGRSALVLPNQNGWICGSDSIALHLSQSSLRPAFLIQYLSLQIVRNQLLSRSMAATMPSLNEGNLLSLRVPFISLARQDELGRQLGRVFEETRALQTCMDKQLDLLIKRRQTLITAAVTGQIDVTTAGRMAV